MEKIPFIKPLLPKIENYNKEMLDVFNSMRFTNKGQKHEKLEKELQIYLSNPNLSLFLNGHLALESIIEMFGFKGEIITTAFTFPSTTHAIVRKGCTPVFCDIKDDLTMDENKIESLITDKTVAILPVHVLGNLCNVEKIEEIAHKHNLKVIYDAAHVFGTKFKGKDISHYGDAIMFSMNITKVFNTIEGGIVAFKDEKCRNLLEKIKYYGIDGEEVDYIGSNLKMTEPQAIMGLLTLPLLKDETIKRESIDFFYRSSLNGCPIKFFEKQQDVTSNYSYFSILLQDQETRDELHQYLLERSIETKKYFYPLASNYKCYKEIRQYSKFPNSDYMSRRILTIPLYGSLSKTELEYIVMNIKTFFKQVQ